MDDMRGGLIGRKNVDEGFDGQVLFIGGSGVVGIKLSTVVSDRYKT